MDSDRNFWSRPEFVLGTLGTDMDLETQLQNTGTDLAKKLQRASTEVEEERGRRNSVG